MTAAKTNRQIATDDHSAEPEPSKYESYRDRAEKVLNRVSTACEAVIDRLADPLDIPDYVLTAATAAGSALVQLAKLDVQLTPAGGRTEIIWDATGDVWVIVGNDRFGTDEFECPASGAILTAAELRERRGPIREFVPRPPRPSD